MPMIRNDFELLINENQWIMGFIDKFDGQEISPKEIYNLFMNFTTFLPQFQILRSKYKTKETIIFFFLFNLIVFTKN